MSISGEHAAPQIEVSGRTVDELVLLLHSHEWKTRERARWDLVALRELAVLPLMQALEDRDWHVRWEAAKALADIRDPRAAPALVGALRDRRFGVRWLASDALIALREAAVAPLLDALIRDADSIWLREGAHHILHDLSRGHVDRKTTEIIKPVIEALEDFEPSIKVPFSAKKALEELPPRIRSPRQ